MAAKPQAQPAAPPQSGTSRSVTPQNPPATPVKKTGAQALHDVLIEEGVEVMFGYPGGAILPTFDVLSDTPLKFYLTRCEQGAGHMADGYSRATGKVGTALVTSGPGATNLTTALATAYMDSIPMVALTGQVATAAIGNDAFQEADVVGVTRPVTKHNVLVKSVKDLPRVIHEAYYLARTGRPGPVLVDPSADPKKDRVMLCRGRVLGGGVSLKPRPIGLVLLPEHQNVLNSSRVANAINRRFHNFRNGVKTGMANHDPAQQRAFFDRMAVKRFGTPEEVAAAAAFLASDEAGFITAEILSVDGGFNGAGMIMEMSEMSPSAGPLP